MTLHRKWSNKVQIPVGTEWGIPYTSTVAECMVWKSQNVTKDPYHDTLGKSKSAVRPPTPPIERCEPDGAYYHGNDRVAAQRNATRLYPRAVTPAAGAQYSSRVTGRATGTGTNYATGLTSHYVDSARDNGYQYTGRDLRDTDRSVNAQIRARSVGPPVSYRDETARAEIERKDDADLIASFLESRDAVSYEQAKQDLYEHTYQQQLEDERRRLYEQRQREYDAHVNAHSGNAVIDDRALQDALKSHVRVTSSRPPRAPRPPAGVKSEHKASFTDPRAVGSRKGGHTPTSYTGSRKVGHAPVPTGYVENLTVTTTTDGDAAVKNLQRAALSRTLLHAPDYRDLPPTPPVAKPVKRVNFRPMSATSGLRSTRKGNHFFEWRDATAEPPSRDQLWKMSKYQHVPARIDNRWTVEPYGSNTIVKSAEQPGKVNVNLECPEGEEMNVNLRVEATPSRNGYVVPY